MSIATAAALGVVPTRSLGGPDALVAMGVGCGASALAVALGSLPVVWALQKGSRRVPSMTLVATGVRIGMLALLIVPVCLVSWVPVRVLLVWVAVSYLSALGGETLALAMLIRRMGTSG